MIVSEWIAVNLKDFKDYRIVARGYRMATVTKIGLKLTAIHSETITKSGFLFMLEGIELNALKFAND